MIHTKKNWLDKDTNIFLHIPDCEVNGGEREEDERQRDGDREREEDERERDGNREREKDGRERDGNGERRCKNNHNEL